MRQKGGVPGLAKENPQAFATHIHAMDREERVRRPTNRFTFGTLGGANPTPPPVDTTTKKKPKYHLEPIKDDGSSDSFLTGGFMPVLAPTSPVAAGGSAVAAAPDVVVITDDDDEEEDEDDTFRLQRPHPLVLSHLYNDDEVKKVKVSATGKGKHTVFDDE